MPVRTWVACAKDASVPASLELRVCSKFVGRVTGVYSREYNILGKMIADGISFGIFIATGIVLHCAYLGRIATISCLITSLVYGLLAF